MSKRHRTITVNLPDNWRFSDLQLVRHPDNGDISVRMDQLHRILSPQDVEWLMSSPEQNLADVLTEVYQVAVERLGAEDTVMEQLIAEVGEGE